MEILEAGTGHGALTLYLSRAIHAANPPRPPRFRSIEGEKSIFNKPTKSTISSKGKFDKGNDQRNSKDAQEPQQNTRASTMRSVLPFLASDHDTVSSAVNKQAAAIDATTEGKHDEEEEVWKKQRRAIIHTVEDNITRSQHARKVVNEFRNGMYTGNVDFHVGDVSHWVQSRLGERNPSDSQFLSHVFLDLPGPESHLTTISKALHIDGTLAIFSPSITQIVECAEFVRRENLPFFLEQVVELTSNSSSGRPWSVRTVKPRPRNHDVLKGAEAAQELSTEDSDSTLVEPVVSEDGSTRQEDELDRTQLQEPEKRPEEKMVMSCRPTPGKVVGGGFLGLWKRMSVR
jgi:hypothetical protein